MIPQAAHGHDRAFLSDIIKRFPFRFRHHLAAAYTAGFNQLGRRRSNLKMIELSESIKQKTGNFNLVQQDSELVEKARSLSKSLALTYRAVGLPGMIDSALIRIRAEYLPDIAITEPDYEQRVAARLMCDKWWRRALRKQLGRVVEGVGRDINLVNKKNGIYATDETVKRRYDQKARNRAILEEMNAVNELGAEFTLQQLSDLSVSNPAIRRGELMTRIAGFQSYATSRGDVGEFWTATLPGRYHSSLSKTGRLNPKYDGSSPRVGQQRLARVWSWVRAEYARQGIEVYGFRVAEPHADGTPHWHLLLFMEPEHREAARAIYKDYLLQEEPGERGAGKYRFKSVAMREGGAAAYIAKYISKNIDGHGMPGDLFEDAGAIASARVDAWAGTWGIRQFQQIGGHSVTVWRELRRLTDEQVDNNIHEHWAAADAGCWCAYLQAMDKRPVSLEKVLNESPGLYGEEKGEQIFGVSLGEIIYVTRIHEWTITQGGGVQSSEAPWSPVNNCTEAKRAYERQTDIILNSAGGVAQKYGGEREKIAILAENGGV